MVILEGLRKYKREIVRRILELQLFDRAVGAKILRQELDCRGFSASAKNSTRSLRNFSLDGVPETGSHVPSSLADVIALLRCYCKHCASAYLDAHTVGA